MPTAKFYSSSWGNTPNPDNLFILGNKEAFRMPFDVGTWTNLRVSAYLSMTDNVADNTATPATETTTNNVNENFFFGIKTSTNSIIPGNAGTVAAGVGSTTGCSYNSAGLYITSVGAIGFNGTTVATNSAVGNSPPLHHATLPRLWVADYIIANRGTATQTLRVRGIQASNPTGTDTTITALRTAAASAAAGLAIDKTLTWNNGSTPFDIPDAVYIRVPFNSLRLRIHSVDVQKIS